MNKLCLCKRCLYYIRLDEAVCPFCRGDPESESEEYQRNRYREKIMVQSLAASMRNFKKRAGVE